MMTSTIVEISVVCQTKQTQKEWKRNLQQQKLVWSVRHNLMILVLLDVSTIVEISVVCQTSPISFPLPYLSTIVEISVVCQTAVQQVVQKAVIYNSRNQCGLLDDILNSLSVVLIYNSRNQCGLLDIVNFFCCHSLIYNSRNQCGLLDYRQEVADYIKSTIVEISVVCQTISFSNI